jgi:hypothetical protein
MRRLSVQPGLSGSNDVRVGRKMANFQLVFFSVQGTGGSPTGPVRRIGWVIKALEGQVGQFLTGSSFFLAIMFRHLLPSVVLLTVLTYRSHLNTITRSKIAVGIDKPYFN